MLGEGREAGVVEVALSLEVVGSPEILVARILSERFQDLGQRRRLHSQLEEAFRRELPGGALPERTDLADDGTLLIADTYNHKVRKVTP